MGYVHTGELLKRDSHTDKCLQERCIPSLGAQSHAIATLFSSL